MRCEESLGEENCREGETYVSTAGMVFCDGTSLCLENIQMAIRTTLGSTLRGDIVGDWRVGIIPKGIRLFKPSGDRLSLRLSNT